MKKKRVITLQSLLINRYEELEVILLNHKETPLKPFEFLRIYFQIQRLKKSIKKAQKSISVKTQNPD